MYVLRLRETLLPTRLYRISFGEFSGRLQDGEGWLQDGFYSGAYTDATGREQQVAMTQFQPTSARRAFPCFDEPALKATFKVTIVHPSEMRALSNMPAGRTHVMHDRRWTRTEFVRSPVMSTYLLAMVVGNFAYLETTTRNGFVIRTWARPELVNDTEHSLSVAKTSSEFLTDYFQMTTVIPKEDHVCVPNFVSAMENWGLILYQDVYFIWNESTSTIHDKYLVTKVISHEVAHTWFGNMVTMSWWDELWLSEGFASYLSLIVIDHMFPEWRAFDLLALKDTQTAMELDSSATSWPVSRTVSTEKQIHESFNPISYNKGQALLRMLNHIVGDENFRNAMRVFVRRHQMSTANIDDLWRAFDEVTSMSISTIMNTWTLQMGFPLVTVKRISPTMCQLVQEHFLLKGIEGEAKPHSALGKYAWFIPFEYTTGPDGMTQTVWMNMSSAAIELSEDDWILGNIGYNGYYRVNYEPDDWDKLIKLLNSDHTMFDADNRAGQCRRIRSCKERIANNQRTCVHESNPLVEAFPPFCTVALFYYRNRLPADLKEVVYVVGVRDGSVADWEFLLSRAKADHIATERNLMYKGLAYSSEPWIIWRFLRMTLNSEELPASDAHVIFSSMGQTANGRGILLQFLVEYWDELNDKFGSDMLAVGTLIESATKFVHSQFKLKALEKLYRDRPPAAAASSAAITSLVRIRQNSEWADLHLSNVEAWLQAHIHV
ncbi:PREDICTED: thyrotropin-releasing hormone-degrading ectoenzyme-like [Priapulus caudatus]|uniref:Thyrotropin-releasing hormone-degrading ectoenzyme-like n=1 Tax=Priapulus caudatus TaxID=37621 RepID=A0ABM1DU78_PRICU|nr:PREDICTED: thyrotropin-releasing hormone-degrading ectoenzyme-like [Priapulus caudatus]